MGLNAIWRNNVCKTLSDNGWQVNLIRTNSYFVIVCSEKIYLNLVSINDNLLPNELISLQENYQQEGKMLVHLWEDIWLSKRDVVLSRIKSFLGLNETFHGRKCRLVSVEADQARHFYNLYHLQGFVRSKFHYGLTLDESLIAMASFSELRPMRLKGGQYKSAELVRFASKEGATITGGLSKLIKHFLNISKPNDLMSYADRDWSIGKGYEQLGFTLSAITIPNFLYLDPQSGLRYFEHRLPKIVINGFSEQNLLSLEDYLTSKGFSKVFNTGNLKYHLYL